MRLDKFLANMGVGTRSEVKQLLKKNQVQVNGKNEKQSKAQIDPQSDEITVNGNLIEYVDKVYIMLNKPAGYISATEDDEQPTIVSLIKDFQHLKIFPVGRLDKDTEGLILLTNDGQFNHDIMSPNKHVTKIYRVEAKHFISDDDIEKFAEGIELSDGKTKPARLERTENEKIVSVSIQEGRYHQVKRMFHAIDNEVLNLKRVQIGKLKLDSNLSKGSYRELTEEELELVKQ
ncbi:rRNA pseudouridine synthase [Staphylococcus condimenti]|uniref:Pseudouridine synthase n=1 Tax=Staphylococcus condimenti TaxID=70255 RepID=A0A143P7S9_9STAP|nr:MULTISPECIES: pseudouridine synthase [Staphylococcus]AMY04517.1 16S rRNA pseudouridine(516) synthase [Staphylococcus condimenti]APR60754.1 16S rRNA pseudouridine(516) synthase [Staphylococcus condimenti]MDK8644802.1 pseudouridine synthase [Staphylococcus condimenti]OFO98897.1 16S rRNA pseudouridine(516) synthase [Staphylococcus sp. HMSC065E08]PNZ58593.1 rRNA pseudouridine synthase [Staphylococcus condimenti]